MITIHRDVVYRSLPGFRPLALDLFTPDRPTALCLYLHGGGWRVGSRRVGPGRAAEWTPSFFEQVAASGLAIASLDYRLSGEAPYPAQQQDVLSADRFLTERADEFGLAGALTTIWGVSAGGQLAALHALRPADDLPPVRAAVCWYAPTDLDQLSHDVDQAGGVGDRSAASRESMLLGAPLDTVPELVRAASAVQRSRTDAPPFLFIHGDADINVPPRQSERLASKLIAAGGTATLELVPGGTHMFPDLDDDATRILVQRSIDFLLAA